MNFYIDIVSLLSENSQEEVVEKWQLSICTLHWHFCTLTTIRYIVTPCRQRTTIPQCIAEDVSKVRITE